MLVTVERYRAITGDHDLADTSVTALIEHATELLEDELERPLEQDERTELMWRDREGWLWPRATPIVTAAGWTIEGNGLKPGGLTTPSVGVVDLEPSSTIEVTYTGGYVERTADPSAPNRLPRSVEDDLAWAAYALGHPSTIGSNLPAGATSVRLGDIAVTWPPGGSERSRNDLTVRWSRTTLRLRRRSL